MPSGSRLSSPETLNIDRIMPLALKWAEAFTLKIQSEGIPLSPIQMEDARRIGVKHPERIRLLKYERLGFSEEAEAFGFFVCPMYSLSLGHAIALHASAWTNHRTLAHELRHTVQFENSKKLEAHLRTWLTSVITCSYREGKMPSPSPPLAPRKLPLYGDLCHKQIMENDVEYVSEGLFLNPSTNAIRNLHHKLGFDDQFIYVVNNPAGASGMVFSLEEMEKSDDNDARYGCVWPVMTVHIHPVSVPGHEDIRLVSPPHVRETWSPEYEIFSRWYGFYAKDRGAIATKIKPLSGGETLWRSFIQTGKVTALNVINGTEVEVAPRDDSCFSPDQNRDIWLVYRPERHTP